MPRLPGLRAARERALLSQAELAQRSGVAQSTISHIEQGQPARVGTVRRLAAVLEVEPGSLLGADEGLSPARPVPSDSRGTATPAPSSDRRERMLAQLVGQADRAAERGDTVAVARIAAMLAELDGER